MSLFPELRKELADAFALAPNGAEFVVSRYRDQTSNLRTQLGRILKRAGVEPWPRLFQNLRASRETELANTFPLHVCCAWLGNSPKIAIKHYLSVTDEHFHQATEAESGGATVGAVVVQQVVPSASGDDCPEVTQATRATGVTTEYAVFPEALEVTEYPRQGSNLQHPV